MVRTAVARAALSAEQRQRWRSLDEGYLLARSRSPGELVLRYRRDEVSRRELSTLVAAEQQCLRFLTWAVTDAGEALTVVVRGSSADLDALCSSD